jgi:signal transduction histidine kinase
MLDLYRTALDADEPTLYAAAVEAAVAVTGSEIGYLHLVNEDQETVELGTWSASTLRRCKAVYQRHYPISTAGIWADCARHRRPCIHNDYQGLSRKQGYPEGHVHLVRHLGVPVVCDDRVVLLVGVGNKTSDYDEEDLACLQAIADHAWSLIRHHRQRAALELSDQQFRDLQALVAICVWQWDPVERKLVCDGNVRRIFGVDSSSDFPASIDALLRFIDPQDHASVLDVLNTASPDFAFDQELYGIRADRVPICLHFRGAAYPRFQGRGIILRGILQDITDRKRAEEALREADRRKDEFLAMLAHELRNPLAPIRNAVQVMRRLGTDDPKLRWTRDVIDRQVEHLARLVDDLLDVSRITRGKIELRKESLAVADIVQRALEASRPLIDARRHRFSILMPEEPIRIEGDFVRLAQVISNLLNNAAKYTDEGGQIRLSVERAGGEVAICVRDTGRGIDPAALPHLFDLFYQVDRTLDRTEGGLGIGLSLVKNLVMMHGGTIQAFSAGRGLGSEFVIRLPISGVVDAGSTRPPLEMNSISPVRAE